MPTPTFINSNASQLSPCRNPFDLLEIDVRYKLVRAGTLRTATTTTVGTEMGTPTLASLTMMSHNINTAMQEALNAVARQPTRQRSSNPS